MLRFTPLLGVLLLAGCAAKSGEGPLVRQGEKAPQFSGDLATFVVGKWTLTEYVDPNFAKQLGMSDLVTPTSEQAVEAVFEFTPDKRFSFREVGESYLIEGKWEVRGDTVYLDYTKMDGKAMNRAREDLQKAAEVGTRGAIQNEIVMDFVFQSLMKLTELKVAADTRFLIFSGGSSSGGVLGGQAAGEVLERVAPEAK